MSTKIRLPQWGMAMSEGTVTEWLVDEGDVVELDQEIVEVEAAKVTNRISASSAGIVGKLLVPEGETVNVNEVLCEIYEPGSEPSEGGAPVVPSFPVEELAEVRPTLLASATEPEQFLAEVQVKTTNVAEVLDGEASATLSPTPAGTSGRVTNVVPLARKLAAQKGIDLRTITGTGTSGRIVVRDVQAAIELASTPQPVDSPPVAGNGKGPSSPSVAPSLAEGEREQKLSPMRRIIADRMMSSLRETAQLTLTSTADVTDFAQLRASVGGGARKPGYVEAVVRACALSLREHPSLNARLNENAIVSSDSVNIGVAVAVEGGLVVPVIHNADRLGLADTGERVVEIAEAARSGRLSPDDYAGGTFSVTSLGAQGIDAFTPILNQPESGILGIGRSREVAVRFGKGIAWRHEITLSLTIDHRVIDGYPAALFLQDVVRRLENPRILL